MRFLSDTSRAIAQWLKIDSERGATAIEYGLLLALITFAIIGAVELAGTNLSGQLKYFAEILGS